MIEGFPEFRDDLVPVLNALVLLEYFRLGAFTDLAGLSLFVVIGFLLDVLELRVAAL